ncbi:uncharacterized protein LOC134227631 [Armigeres subalbatus]|uniref:uncharacterized protein LOC134227631 n=1 Tax=Armigeres subalbatus TaxID=124917 RepID=UPI002ED555F2
MWCHAVANFSGIPDLLQLSTSGVRLHRVYSSTHGKYLVAAGKENYVPIFDLAAGPAQEMWTTGLSADSYGSGRIRDAVNVIIFTSLSPSSIVDGRRPIEVTEETSSASAMVMASGSSPSKQFVDVQSDWQSGNISVAVQQRE